MTAACDVPCVNNRAASNRRASNAALRRCPCCGVVMPQHRMVPDDNHHFISRDSLVDPAAEIAEGGADHSVSCRKAPRHLGFEVDLDPVYALDVRRHTLGHGLDVAAKRLGDGVEVSTRLRGGVTHLLPETDKLLTETPQSLVKIGTGLSIHARSLADRPPTHPSARSLPGGARSGPRRRPGCPRVQPGNTARPAAARGPSRCGSRTSSP